jgi:1-acyl-sn-glycerol-3-phosphate acyltransferase
LTEPATAPPRRRTLAQRFFRWVIAALGWKLHDRLPDEPKYLAIAAPHTSNLDFPLGIMAMIACGLPLGWIGKHTLFRWPTRWLFGGLLGGIPVDRRSRHNFVDQIVERFNERERLVIVMSPEGTRHHTDHWKTGFYWIAVGAKIPILLAFWDWKRKELGVGTLLWPTGDIEADLAVIAVFYADKTGRHPGYKSAIALKQRRVDVPDV